MRVVDNKIKVNISGNITYLLNVEEKSRKKVCQDLGFKYTTFCDWVNGKTVPGYQVLEKLGDYFQVEPWTFYENIEIMKKERYKRLNNYATDLSIGKQLDMDILEQLSDDQLKDLLSSGFRFRHRSLEEYIALSGKPLVPSAEVDWGEPVGREIW